MTTESDNYVKISANSTGYTIADAVKFVYTGSGTFKDWLYKTKVYLDTTADGANVNTDVSNFPVLIRLNANNFDFSLAKPDGSDIRFSDEFDNELKYEIERWDKLANIAEIWVLVPQVFSNSNTQSINMHWVILLQQVNLVEKIYLTAIMDSVEYGTWVKKQEQVTPLYTSIHHQIIIILMII